MKGTTSVFFFQAEDGIRDYKVTGVQTCALPICGLLVAVPEVGHMQVAVACLALAVIGRIFAQFIPNADRKSTRLNSSHLVISYAVFCLKKKKNKLIDLSCRIREYLFTLVCKSTC